MTSKELLITNGILACLVLWIVYLTINEFCNISSFINADAVDEQRIEAQGAVEKTYPGNANCTKKSMINFGQVQDDNLQKIAQYQDICDSFVTDHVMFFTVFPADSDDAKILGKQVAQKIKTFHDNGIMPIVIVEPYQDDALILYEDFIEDPNDGYLSVFFTTLQKEGITDEMMGTWVPFPEPNTPNWNPENDDPREYGLSVNKYLGNMKEVFPHAKGSILLNAATFRPNDEQWNNGDYLNFSPYLIDIDVNLVDSFGIQGFPWVADATRNGEFIFSAEEFLQPFLAIAGAKELRTKEIWINTGVFASKYTNDQMKKINLSPSDRRAILNDIIRQIQVIQEYQQNSYRVSINLFLADKSESAEATDWSFTKTQEDHLVFREFVNKLEKSGVSLSIYDGR